MTKAIGADERNQRSRRRIAGTVLGTACYVVSSVAIASIAKSALTLSAEHRGLSFEWIDKVSSWIGLGGGLLATAYVIVAFGPLILDKSFRGTLSA
ncbi:UNVERIFIED_ORG: hypothetical protein M2312_004853 [Rhizobium esperanzae]|nr:hypothetical protein [Rhizobium esperanzae]